MGKLYRKLILICFGFIIYYALFICFDLYDFFGVRVECFNETEDTYIVDEYGTRIRKEVPYPIIKYINNLSNKKSYSVIFGDSKMPKINPVNLAKEDKNNNTTWLNLSYRGCSAEESILEFYYTANRIKLDKVIFELDIRALNAINRWDRLSRIKDLSKWEFYKSYLFEYYNNKMAIRSMMYFLLNKKIQPIENPHKDRKEAYRNVAEQDRKEAEVYKLYRKPVDDMIKIAKYCNENGIKFIIFAPPINGKLYKDVPINNNILEKINNLKEELSYYAPVYDMQYISEVSFMENEWEDAWHYEEGICRIVEDNLIGKNKKYMRIYENGRIIK